jgi:hypothetical protein
MALIQSWLCIIELLLFLLLLVFQLFLQRLLHAQGIDHQFNLRCAKCLTVWGIATFLSLTGD